MVGKGETKGRRRVGFVQRPPHAPTPHSELTLFPVPCAALGADPTPLLCLACCTVLLSLRFSISDAPTFSLYPPPALPTLETACCAALRGHKPSTLAPPPSCLPPPPALLCLATACCAALRGRKPSTLAPPPALSALLVSGDCMYYIR